MKYDSLKHRRCSIRLSDYDYSQFGYYFVTICTQDRELYFHRNQIRHMIDNQWQKLKNKFGVDLDKYTIMPNHLHGIIVISDCKGICRGAPMCAPKYQSGHMDKTKSGQTRGRGQTCGSAPTLGNIIQWFKTMTTNYYIQGVKKHDWPWFPGRLWQRNYFERIIRGQSELNKIRSYIINNLRNWDRDKNNPKNFTT